MGAFRGQVQVAVTAPVTVAMDTTAANAITHQVALKAGISDTKFSVSFVGAVNVAAAAQYADAQAVLAATPSPPKAPALMDNGCLADGSEDVCDVWPTEMDESLFGKGKYNYFYDEDDAFHRIGSRDPIFTPTQFTNNGVCEDGLPSLNGNPSRTYKLYVYNDNGNAISPQAGDSYRWFGGGTAGSHVLEYAPCVVGHDCSDCGHRADIYTPGRRLETESRRLPPLSDVSFIRMVKRGLANGTITKMDLPPSYTATINSYNLESGKFPNKAVPRRKLSVVPIDTSDCTDAHTYTVTVTLVSDTEDDLNTLVDSVPGAMDGLSSIRNSASDRLQVCSPPVLSAADQLVYDAPGATAHPCRSV